MFYNGSISTSDSIGWFYYFNRFDGFHEFKYWFYFEPMVCTWPFKSSHRNHSFCLLSSSLRFLTLFATPSWHPPYLFSIKITILLTYNIYTCCLLCIKCTRIWPILTQGQHMFSVLRSKSHWEHCLHTKMGYVHWPCNYNRLRLSDLNLFRAIF